MDLDLSEIAIEVKEKRILHWNYRELKELPIVVKNHGSQVREIYLKCNKLKSLPAWIGELKNLRNLYLCGNLIRKLPPEMEFSRLTVLDLNSNRLEFIPTCIASLITLKFLFLDDNFISRIPPACKQLENLECLSISRNRLEILPEWIGSLRKLEDLILDNNFLEELPNRLTLAPELSSISVCSNRLRFLPLNGFVSSPFIRFDTNRDLNYLSYSLLCQLMSKIQNSLGRDLRNVVARGCFQKSATESRTQNQRLQIAPEEYDGTEEITIEFPRQLIKVYKIANNVVCSLWELALRRVYKNRYRHTLEIRTSPLDLKVVREPVVSEKNWSCCRQFLSFVLMKNGPVGICTSDFCQEPIFTESWVIFGLGSEFYDVPTVALFCSRRCAHRFVNSPRNSRYFLNQ